jgi:hypothetical protein
VTFDKKASGSTNGLSTAKSMKWFGSTSMAEWWLFRRRKMARPSRSCSKPSPRSRLQGRPTSGCHDQNVSSVNAFWGEKGVGSVCKFFALCVAILFADSTGATAQTINDKFNAITFFAAELTKNNFEDFFAPSDIHFRDTYQAGAGYSRRLTTFFDKLDIEAMGQTAVHFGHAHQWEFDAALVARWTYFPWNNFVRTSFGFGVGPSYETQVPPEEVALHGQSEQWLGFWLAELTVGLPDSLWSGVIRLHHRSTTFGLFGKTGGSNWLALGIRRDF